MKLKHLFTLLVMMSCALLGFTACDDNDYAPIRLINTDESGQQVKNHTLAMYAFSKGESFYIKGGDGHYTITNNSEGIIDYRYDGKVLTFMPVGLGTATLIIRDLAKNSLVLTIEVSNRKVVLNVTGVESYANGRKMIVEDVDRLRQQIINESFAKEGGRYEFTYTDDSQVLGSVTIYPSETGKPISGIFRQEKKYTEEGVEHVEFTITTAKGNIHKMMLINEGTETTNRYTFQEDVTNVYNKIYPNVEKALLIQNVTF